MILPPVPLATALIMHSDASERAQVLDQLIRRLYRDPDAPFAPSPAVPVLAGRISDDGSLRSPLVGIERTAALVVLEDHAISDPKFLSATDHLVATADPNSLRVFLVPYTQNAFRLTNSFAQTHYLRFENTPLDLRWTRIGSGLAHELCRWLQGLPRSVASSTLGTIAEPAITVFLSHAKSDGSSIAHEFVAHLQSNTRLNAFFDAHDLTPAFPFASEIQDRIAASILLVIRTDAYGTREWCQREVLTAKSAGVPVVMVDALNSADRRSFPYLGNIPTIRYQSNDAQRHERVLDLLLDETLRQMHFRARVGRQMHEVREPRPVVFGCAPELVQFALTRGAESRKGSLRSRRRRHVVYPDPPLSGPETEILDHDAEVIRAESLTQFVARRAGRLTNVVVAVSTSEAELTGRGLSPLHQRDFIVELARHLFAAGARIAYGGDFRKAGFAELLVEVQRAHSRYTGSASPRISSYLPEPLAAEERAPYVDTVEFVNVAFEEEGGAVPAARGRALRLRAMRRQIAQDSAAIVVAGGRTSGFSGWRPGIAEEIAMAAIAGRPIYLIGGFGGAAGEYAQAVIWKGAVPHSPLASDLGPEPSDKLALPSPSEIVRLLRRRGFRNCLSKAENAQLASSVDTDQIVGLVLRGLASISKARTT